MPICAWNPGAKYWMPPLPSPATYGTERMWLNMCPDVNSRMAIMLRPAHTLRLYSSGDTHGHATTTPVRPPSVSSESVRKRSQLKGRCTAGLGASSGRCRASQPWTDSADCGLVFCQRLVSLLE